MYGWYIEAMDQKIAIFRQKQIRRTIHINEWWFSVVDVIAVLVGPERPRKYWNDLKNKITEEGYIEVSEKIGQLKMMATDGKYYETDCANTETLFRIVQSIPSPKAEPFKRWLAKVGYERIQEIEDPELAHKRAWAIYKAKGYPDSWIDQRIRSIEIREGLTEEWLKHGVTHDKEFEILTAEIAQATFSLKPSQHKTLKGLKRQNLRDHMTNLELIFSMLDEASTTEITQTEHPQGFIPNKKVSKRGGAIAGNARKQLERETGKSVVTRQNYLQTKTKKLL